MISPAAHDLFRKLYGGAERVLLTTHINPDGDALGSQLGLVRFLKAGGKTARIVNHDPAPENLSFLEDDAIPIEIYDPSVHDAALRAADLVILVDNSAPDRLGTMETVMRAVAGRVLCIDHHPSRGTPWAYPILDEESCATALMIYDLIRTCGWTPNREAAEALYVGLATDTGFFRFNSTSARAHQVAAELLELGAASATAYREIYERNSLAYTRLLGHALVGLELAAGGLIATVTLRRELIKDLKAEEEDSSEIATSMLAMEGIRVALLFRELPDGRVKVSLRSKGDFDVHLLAGEFGGGGHRNASGIVIVGRLAEVVSAVKDKTAALLAHGAAKKRGS